MSVLTRWAARRHGGMAAAYERFTAPLEHAGLSAIRAALAADLCGRVLEIGCGTGLNFPHYDAAVALTAVEPLEDFRVFAAERARGVGARVAIVEADAQALPFASRCFDAALETLALCSVADAARGLHELRRVLRPGAPVRFFEHVRSPHRAGALLQDLANPLWRWLMDGCNLNRDTVAAIDGAGFAIELVRPHDLQTPGTPRFPFREIRARA